MTLTYTEDSCRQWAVNAGGSIAAVASDILDGTGPARQKTKLCGDLMRLADKYSLERLEKACSSARTTGGQPSVQLIDTLLRKGREAGPFTAAPEASEKKTAGLTRGKSYYTRGAK